ncbi:hypothetical protein Taro_055226 [Colocasia esculenta]|uniref:Uncharacterized protein n=1 Tax=Colocasia esculenta TaxID=4460 RepID=A0A843XQG5_COLES|nr:hypothetical protein [Colocasia esculenta]
METVKSLEFSTGLELSVYDKASRGRHGVPAREGEQRRDELRREDQGEQQAPTPQGPVLPPPPPVDYGVTLEQALSAACRQEGEMEQYLEEKKASQKRPAAPFQRQERKKATFQSPQRPVASGSSQVPSQRSPNGKNECPHCGRAHGGTECWKLAGKCLKCGSSKYRIKDCPRLQQGGQRGAAPAPTAVVAPATGRPRGPRAPARVFALAREDAE